MMFMIIISLMFAKDKHAKISQVTNCLVIIIIIISLFSLCYSSGFQFPVGQRANHRLSNCEFMFLSLFFSSLILVLKSSFIHSFLIPSRHHHTTILHPDDRVNSQVSRIKALLFHSSLLKIPLFYSLSLPPLVVFEREPSLSLPLEIMIHLLMIITRHPSHSNSDVLFGWMTGLLFGNLLQNLRIQQGRSYAKKLPMHIHVWRDDG